MEVQSPPLTFPANFCCNCGDTNCSSEIQDTRITRYFGIYGTETTFQLAIPICAACRRTLRRRPAGFFSRLLVLVLMCSGWFLALLALGRSVTLAPIIAENQFQISVGLGAISALIFYRLRRARPPRTSFYQPVRIKQADVKFADVMNGPGQVRFIKLAFTNPDYLNVFANANRDAIAARHLAVVKA